LPANRKKPEAVRTLIAFADAHGIDQLRGIAINAVLVDGTVHDPVARLWAQVERTRAYLADRRGGNEVAPKQGLWFDQLDGKMILLLSRPVQRASITL
jgi:mannose/cellobiose epimerase-like protein (N-acyl-D-glucosamine 2-epimerase family)